MAAANTASSTPAPVAPVPACQRNSSEESGWTGKFQGFFQRPMEEHKACFKIAVQKMADDLKELKEKTARFELKELKEKTGIWKTKEHGKQVPAVEEASLNK